MSRTTPLILAAARRALAPLARLRTRDRVMLAGFLTLLLVLAAASFVPRGEDPDEGTLTPVTAPRYAARTTPAGPGTVTPQARAEIDRVLAQAPARLSARAAPTDLADDLVRCAEFEEQRYCLGIGWTRLDDAGVRAAATAPRSSGRSIATETTGDLATADLLAQRAELSPTEREAVERRELEAAARSVAKVVLLRHQLLGESLPAGFLERHPEARASAGSTSARAAAPKTLKDYPRRSTVLSPRKVREQHTTYWCGPTAMQMIGWGWQDRRRTQRYWADKLGTTTSGTAISQMVRVVNSTTGYDRENRAGNYIVLDISDWEYRQWLLLQMRHIEDYRAPVVLHPILLRQFFPYLDDDASGHFQVGRGYDKRGKKPAHLGFFEPWNQQRFDRSEPRIARVQWRSAYQSYRANRAHPHQNIGV